MEAFAPYQQLAQQLLPHAQMTGDAAHDSSHIVRVWSNAVQLHHAEGGDMQVLAAAVLLHDCVQLAKGSAFQSRASRLAAKRAGEVLTGLGWPADRIEKVSHAIESHSFSAGIEPKTLEARILQDADRLDAIGHMGIARCLYTAGRIGSELYNVSDPEGAAREFDDAQYALDHFPKKLLLLAEGFKTKTGQQLARERHHIVHAFYTGMLAEIRA